MMKPRVIKTEEEHARALRRIDELFDSEPGTAEGDELELLSLLVDQYETVTFPIENPEPVAAIRFRMEQQGLTERDLISLLGGAEQVREVLSGRQDLTIQMIRNLVRALAIPADVLVQPSLATIL